MVIVALAGGAENSHLRSHLKTREKSFFKRKKAKKEEEEEATAIVQPGNRRASLQACPKRRIAVDSSSAADDDVGSSSSPLNLESFLGGAAAPAVQIKGASEQCLGEKHLRK